MPFLSQVFPIFLFIIFLFLFWLYPTASSISFHAFSSSLLFQVGEQRQLLWKEENLEALFSKAVTPTKRIELAWHLKFTIQRNHIGSGNIVRDGDYYNQQGNTLNIQNKLAHLCNTLKLLSLCLTTWSDDYLSGWFHRMCNQPYHIC